MKANEYIKKYGVDCAKEILFHNQDLMNIGFFIDLKRLVESHELVERLGGFERAKKAITLSDKKLGYTHVYLHSNKFYCFLDDSVDYIIPDKAIDIRLALKAIADVESCMEVPSESN